MRSSDGCSTNHVFFFGRGRFFLIRENGTLVCEELPWDTLRPKDLVKHMVIAVQSFLLIEMGPQQSARMVIYGDVQLGFVIPEP